MKMRIGKMSTVMAQFSRPLRVVNAAASELKVARQAGGWKVLKTIAVFGAAAGSCSTMAYASDEAEAEAEQCPCYPWPHKGSADTPRLFQDACSSCHSMSLVSYRHKLVEEETKAIAAEILIQVVDPPNQKSARLMAYHPADLSLITKARLNDNHKYGLSLLTAGVKGLHQFQYNPYNFNLMPKNKMLLHRGVAATQAQIREDDVTSVLC